MQTVVGPPVFLSAVASMVVSSSWGMRGEMFSAIHEMKAAMSGARGVRGAGTDRGLSSGMVASGRVGAGAAGAGGAVGAAAGFQGGAGFRDWSTSMTHSCAFLLDTSAMDMALMIATPPMRMFGRGHLYTAWSEL